MTKLVWLLNLDADKELERPANFQTRRETLRQVERAAPLLELLTRNEEVLELQKPRPRTPMERAIALPWCPTPSARRRLDQAGWASPNAPELAVLRRVNHRAFPLACSRSDDERHWVNPDDDLCWLSKAPPLGYRLKRPFGLAGKGQRVVRPPLSDDDRRWIEDSLQSGFLLEPNRHVLAEWTVHGVVDRAGTLLGEPCHQNCDRFGQPTSIRREPLDHELARTLQRSATEVAEQLASAGYFGPFGVDSLLYSTPCGTSLQLASDVNARFSLGWSVGMAEAREPALERIAGYS